MRGDKRLLIGVLLFAIGAGIVLWLWHARGHAPARPLTTTRAAVPAAVATPLLPPPSPPPPKERSLDSVLKFDDPRSWDESQSLRDLFQKLGSLQSHRTDLKHPHPIFVSQIGVSITPTLSSQKDPDGTVEMTAWLPLAGTWNGLRVRGLRVSGSTDSDYFSDEIWFAEKPEQVRSVLKGRGFDLPATGVWRDLGEDSSVTILAVPGGSSVVFG